MRAAKARVIVCLLALIAACGGSSKRVAPRPAPAPLRADAYGHYLRGQVALFEGDFVRAVAELTRACQVAPEEAPIAVALISALYESGDRAAADRAMRAAEQRWPKSAQVWMKSGALYRGTDEHAKAAKSFRRALRFGADTHVLFLDYAGELAAIGERKKAEGVYRKLITTGEASDEAHYQLARLLYQDANPKASARHLEKAVELSPYDLRAWALLSVTLRQLGEPERALQALRHPFDRSGGDARVAEQLFVELLELGPPAHVHELAPALDRDDLSLDTRIGMGHLQMRTGDFAAALATADRLALVHASGAPLEELRARALMGLGRGQEAEGALRGVAASDPGYPLMQAMLANLLAEQGKLEEASGVLDAASKSFPDDAELTLARAQVFEESGQIEEARQVLQEAVSAHPRASRPLYALAELLSRHGELAAAIALIAPLIDADPRDASALNYVGYTLISQKAKWSRARILLLRALELEPDNSSILDSYGWYLLCSSQLQRARPYLERAARLAPAEAEVLLHLAELRWRLGEEKDAMALFRRAESLASAPAMLSKIRQRQQILVGKP